MLKKIFYMVLAFVILLLVLYASSRPLFAPKDSVDPAPSDSSKAAVQTYNNPFAYCAAVGTMDTPDARYVGPPVSDDMIHAYQTAAGLEKSNENLEFFRETTVWRCMDSQVYVCNFGANLLCDSKANDDLMLSPAMVEFCSENPNPDNVPLSVTGHNTLFSWQCEGKTPKFVKEIAKKDKAGYVADIWYPIQSKQETKP